MGFSPFPRDIGGYWRILEDIGGYWRILEDSWRILGGFLEDSLEESTRGFSQIQVQVLSH